MKIKRLLLFKIIALVLPLFLLALVEVGLRIIEYGYDYQIFVEDSNDPAFLVMNPHASKKFFTEVENATIGNFEKFKKEKDENTFRIFILGESTAIGYPYMHNGSFHRWVQYRLMHNFPEKNFEIINLSMTAVNSYTVQDFAKQIPPYEPDAVFIYVGHNEFYGAMGIGSTSEIGGNPYLIRIILKLREFRLVQFLGNTLSKSVRILFNNSDSVDLRENLMKRMAAEQQIPYASEMYKKGINQFESNLLETLRALEKEQIPVLISTLVSNEKDLKPFLSDTTDVSHSAIHHFTLAQKANEQNEFIKAKQLFQMAKDLDMLRFRAPEAITQVLRTKVEEFPNAVLVDSKALFEAHSTNGILGEETLLEHVHPNLLGYALLSEAFYQKLEKQQLIVSEETYKMTFKELLQQMPITLVDSLKGAYEIMMLKEGWPFNEPISDAFEVRKTFESQLAGGVSVKQISWSEAMKQLYNYYLKENNLAEALKVSEALLLENPYDQGYYMQAGKLSLSLEDNRKGIFYLKKAFDIKPNYEASKGLFITLLKLDRPKEALNYLDFALANKPSDASMIELQFFVRQIIVLKEKYEINPSDVQLANQIALSYLNFANTSASSVYVKKSLQLMPNNPEALAVQEQIDKLIK